MAGRHRLSQSALSSIPTFLMLSMYLPKGVCGAMDKLIRSFLWNGALGKQKAHTINWNIVTRSKQHGDWGLKRRKNDKIRMENVG